MTLLYYVCDKKSGLIIAEYRAPLNNHEQAKRQAHEHAKRNGNYFVALRWE